MTTIQDLERQLNRVQAELAQVKSDARLLSFRLDNTSLEGDSLRVKAGTTDAIRTDGAIVSIANRLARNGEVDNFIGLSPNRQSFFVGGTELLRLYNGNQDVIKFGDGADIDINFNDMMFMEGSTGNFGIGTRTIPHGGVGSAKLAIEGADGSVLGPHVQFTTPADDYPLFQMFNWWHDSVHLLFDSYYDGSYRSSDAGSNFGISKAGDQIRLVYDSGVAQGDAITWNNGFVLGATGKTFINDTTNAFMSIGLTINQGVSYDEILAFKQSVVDHGMTSIVETDTYGKFGQVNTDIGGLYVGGYRGAGGGASQAVHIAGHLGEAADTGKTVSDYGIIALRASVKSGISITAVAADGNLVSITNYATTRWVLDGKGTMHQIPGSDVDHDLIALQVTGTPTFGWNESEDIFSFTKGASFVELVGVGTTTPRSYSSHGIVVYDTITPAIAFVNTSSRDWFLQKFNDDLRVYNATDGWVMTFEAGGTVHINDTTNSKMTVGLTINQEAADDQILAFNSSDVDHGITDAADADTFGMLQKVEGGSGGLLVAGYKDAAGTESTSLQLVGKLSVAADTTKTTTSRGVVGVESQVKSGTGVTSVGADGNLFSIQNYSAARWILDAEGTAHHIPGADIDIDLITVQVGVPPAPTFGWNESEDQFDFNRGANFTGNVDVLGSGVDTSILINESAGTNLARMWWRTSTRDVFADLDFSSALFNLWAIDGDNIDFHFQTNSTIDQLWLSKNDGRVHIGGTDPDSMLVIASDVFIGPPADSGNTANVKSTTGLTINQDTADDEIVAFKSSDVSHGMTALTETDTFGAMTKSHPGSGGLAIEGFKDADDVAFYLDPAISINGYLGETANASNNTSAQGVVRITAAIKSGTSITSVGSNGILVAIRNYLTTRWMVDAEGDVFSGGTHDGTISDHLDDVNLLTGFLAAMSPKGSPAYKRFKGFIGDTETILVQQGVLTAPLSEGGLVSDTGLKGLLIDAIIQLKSIAMQSNDKITQLSNRIAQLEAQLN